MTSISELIPVTLIYDPNLGAPIETQPLGGKVLLVPPTLIPPPQRGVLYGQRGYSRQVGGAWEWVMIGDTDPVEAFVDTLAGGGHWRVAAARADMVLFCQQLLRLGIPSGTIAARIPQIVSSIAAEVQAETATP